MSDLLAISDLHTDHAQNSKFVDGMWPESAGDWLLVAGDVADYFERVVATLTVLRERFKTVIWVPGNHELWTLPDDPVQDCGVARYLKLVEALRCVDVITPEDPYPVWTGTGDPVVIAPLFLLYDYTFRPPDAHSEREALEIAEAAGVLCTDEILLQPDPYVSRIDWCRARLSYTQARLDALPAGTRTVLVNHWPLVRDPTSVLHFPEFALWCGTTATADWPIRYHAQAVVYGHLHIPRTLHIDGIPHYEVSLGYPREWKRPGALTPKVARILPNTASGLPT